MTSLVRALPAAGWLLLLVGSTGAHGQQRPRQRYRAMEWPAAPTLGLSPRHYLGAQLMRATGDGLGKRSDVCDEGYHLCSDLPGALANFCCPNDKYCIVNPHDSSAVQCCGIGMTCASPCSEEFVAVSLITTVTTSGVVSTETTSACSPRKCPSTSQFYCPLSATTVLSSASVTTSFSGSCCSYGFTCGLSGGCVFTPAPSSTRCAQGKSACPSILGGGCCASTAACIEVDGSAYCSSIAATPTASGATAVYSDSDSLGAGAKAGIAIVVILGWSLVIGAATWWCLRRRRTQRGQAGSSASGTTLAGAAIDAGDRSRSTPLFPTVGRFIGRSVPGTGHGRRGVAIPPGRTMTETISENVSRGGLLPGMTQDYFGPDPARGLYTSEDDPREFSAFPGSTPAHELGRKCGAAVPTKPHGPDDIFSPVEIKGREMASAVGRSAREHANPVRVPGEHEMEQPEETHELSGEPAPGLAPPTLEGDAGSPEPMSPYTDVPESKPLPRSLRATLGKGDSASRGGA